MPSLYDLKEKNIVKTWIYLAGFLVLISGLGYVASEVFGSPAVFWFAVGLSLFMSFLSYWFSDKIVLSMTRAKPIEKKDNPELYRLVENLCITAGLPVPKVYIMEDSAPNAFATGRDPEHSALVVTRGLLDALDRSELEGVIAHELSHIGNRDTLIATIVVVLVGVVIRMTDLFFRMRRGDRKEGGGLVLVVSLFLLILAPVLAQMLRFAISRRREFLADAEGALLTRYPEGLASALEKIARDKKMIRRSSNATAHLFIEDPFKDRHKKSFMMKLFSTHPPMEERIRALRGMEV